MPPTHRTGPVPAADTGRAVSPMGRAQHPPPAPTPAGPLTASSRVCRAGSSCSTRTRPASSWSHRPLDKPRRPSAWVPTSASRPWKSSVTATESSPNPSAGRRLELPGCPQAPGEPWSGRADSQGQKGGPQGFQGCQEGTDPTVFWSLRCSWACDLEGTELGWRASPWALTTHRHHPTLAARAGVRLCQADVSAAL